MKEGELPGSNTQRSAEEMMTRGKKGELPTGITRVRVPKEAKDVTEGLPKSILGAGTVSEGSDKPTTNKPPKKS